MTQDPIVAEVRRAREEYARRFDFDLWAIFEDLKRKERSIPHLLVNRARNQPSIEQRQQPPVPIEK